MLKHKSEDYKLSAVNYYLNNNISLDDGGCLTKCG